jgi:hypothetical protein
MTSRRRACCGTGDLEADGARVLVADRRFAAGG